MADPITIIVIVYLNVNCMFLTILKRSQQVVDFQPQLGWKCTILHKAITFFSNEISFCVVLIFYRTKSSKFWDIEKQEILTKWHFTFACYSLQVLKLKRTTSKLCKNLVNVRTSDAFVCCAYMDSLYTFRTDIWDFELSKAPKSRGKLLLNNCRLINLRKSSFTFNSIRERIKNEVPEIVEERSFPKPWLRVFFT